MTYDDEYQVTSTLTLGNVSPESAYIYYCVGSNQLDTFSVGINLEVKCKLNSHRITIIITLLF